MKARAAVLPAVLSARDVAAVLGIGMSTLSRWRLDPTFPAPIELGPRRVGWRREDLDAWIASRPRRRAS